MQRGISDSSVKLKAERNFNTPDFTGVVVPHTMGISRIVPPEAGFARFGDRPKWDVLKPAS